MSVCAADGDERCADGGWMDPQTNLDPQQHKNYREGNRAMLKLSTLTTVDTAFGIQSA